MKKVLQIVRRKIKEVNRYRALTGKAVSRAKNIVRYGSEYGGFAVESADLGKDSITYSFGIGEDLSFSEEINSKIECEIYAFDPTPKEIVFL